MIRFKYQPPGTPPGELRAREGASPTAKLRLIQYNADSLTDETFPDWNSLTAKIDRSKVNWIDIDGLGDIDTIRAAGETFGLHPLALEDALNTTQRPKVESFENHFFIVSQMIYFKGSELCFEQISLFLGEYFIITLQEEAEQDIFDSVRNRLKSGRGFARRLKADYLAYALLDTTVDQIFPILESIGDSIEEVEEELLEKPQRSSLRELYDSKRLLLAIRRSAWPHREIFGTLLRDDTGLIARGTQVFLRDCYDHTTQIIDIIESYRDLSAGLMDLYLSSVGFRTNEIIRILTIVSVVFIPLTFLAGVYGMNFDTEFKANMPELHWHYGYVYFWLLCLAISGAMLLFFKRRNWL